MYGYEFLAYLFGCAIGFGLGVFIGWVIWSGVMN